MERLESSRVVQEWIAVAYQRDGSRIAKRGGGYHRGVDVVRRLEFKEMR